MSRFSRLGALGAEAVLGAALLGSAAAAADSPAASDTGVWQKHEYRFQFMGFTTTYSCDGLADKLAVLLKYSGARKDVKAYPGACASSIGRPDKFANASLTFYSLAPPQGTPDEKTVPAVWRQINVSRRMPRELDTGDCELIEQFRTNILPLLTTRQVDSHTTCIPHQLSGSSIDLKFEALTPPPLPPKK